MIGYAARTGTHRNLEALRLAGWRLLVSARGKLQTHGMRYALEWGALARDTGCYLHVARVNTVRRVRLCDAAGADSFDGSSVTRFACNLPRLDFARRGRDLFAI